MTICFSNKLSDHVTKAAEIEVFFDPEKNESALAATKRLVKERQECSRKSGSILN